MNNLLPVQNIREKIFMIRGFKVMLDRDLAELYGVEIRVLNQAVRRNIKRFPEDFMFQLTLKEESLLRSQIVILEGKGKHSKYLSMAFTEQGVSMLSSVLKSDRAIQVNIQISDWKETSDYEDVYTAQGDAGQQQGAGKED